jgi:hypothetical protein
MELNDLLLKKSINAEKVLVLRHRPFEKGFSKVFPWLAANRPDLFNAYQSTQGEQLERAMQKAQFVASFIGNEPGKAIFIGLYEIGEAKSLTREEYWAVPAYAEMKALGMEGFSEERDKRETILRFDLKQQDEFFPEWKGKLVVGWPPPERSWWRWAERNTMPILAVHEESVLDKVMPDWREIVLTWGELRVLPETWKNVLRQWCAVYYIHDSAENKGYVGSASGEERLLQRWENYAATGHGGNVLLRGCDHNNFTFSILQLIPPDIESQEIIRVESTWKKRLHTQAPAGLNDN